MKHLPTYLAIFSLIVLLPGVLFAAEGDFIPLVGLPYIGDGGGPKHFGDYVKALYYAAISIGAFLAVIKIIFSGVKYMLTDVVTTKGDAKKDIYGALIGLLIVVGAVLILQTINPKLLDIKLFNEAPVPYINTDTTTIKSDNPCTINENSQSCCSFKGGKYSVLLNQETKCDLGEEITVGEGKTGDEVYDRLNCLSTGIGFVWDSVNKVCRLPGAEERPLPPEAEDLDPSNPNDLPFFRVACATYGTQWSYNPVNNNCIDTQPSR